MSKNANRRTADISSQRGDLFGGEGVGFKVEGFVGREIQYGVLVEREVYVVFEFDGACEPHAHRYLHASATEGCERVDGLLYGLCAEGHAVAHGSMAGD